MRIVIRSRLPLEILNAGLDEGKREVRATRIHRHGENFPPGEMPLTAPRRLPASRIIDSTEEVADFPGNILEVIRRACHHW